MHCAYSLKQIQIKQLTSDWHLDLVEGVLQNIVSVEIIHPAHVQSDQLLVRETDSAPVLCTQLMQTAIMLQCEAYVDLRKSSTSGVPGSTTSRNFVPVSVWKQCKSNVSAINSSIPEQPGTGDNCDAIACRECLRR